MTMDIRDLLTKETQQAIMPDREKFLNPFNHDGWLAYFHQLLQRFRFIRFLGLPSPKDLPNVLHKNLYVPLYLGTSYSSDKDNKNDIFTIGDSLNRFRRLVLLGDPGAGKSTLVSHMVNLFAGRKNHEYTELLGNLIPIPLILRELKIGKNITFDDLLKQFMAQTIWPEELSREDLNQVMESGQALFLLDGLDEVGSKTRREALRTAILEEGMQTYPSCAWALTSRIIGYEEVPFEFIKHETKKTKKEDLPNESTEEIIEDILIIQHFPNKLLYVLPFNDKQIQTFIKKWYLVREEDEHLREESVESLSKAIDETPNIKRLAQTPFLLTMMAIIHRNHATLPSGRVQIYDLIVEAYLDSIDKFRKLKSETGLQPNQHRIWLSRLAYEMQAERNNKVSSKKNEGKSDLERSEILVPKERVLSKIEELSEDQIDTELELKHISSRSGLFIPKGPDMYSFVHLSFQEYFASLFLYEKVMSFSERDKAIDEVKKLRGNAIWHETIILLFEKLSNHPEASDFLFDKLVEGEDSSSIGPDLLLYLALLGDFHSGLSPKNREKILYLVFQSPSYLLKLKLYEKSNRLPNDITEQYFIPAIKKHLSKLASSKIVISKELLLFLQNLSTPTLTKVSDILIKSKIFRQIPPDRLLLIYPMAIYSKETQELLLEKMPIKKWFSLTSSSTMPITECTDYSFPQQLKEKGDLVKICSSFRVLINSISFKLSLTLIIKTLISLGSNPTTLTREQELALNLIFFLNNARRKNLDTYLEPQIHSALDWAVSKARFWYLGLVQDQKLAMSKIRNRNIVVTLDQDQELIRARANFLMLFRDSQIVQQNRGLITTFYDQAQSQGRNLDNYQSWITDLDLSPPRNPLRNVRILFSGIDSIAPDLISFVGAPIQLHPFIEIFNKLSMLFLGQGNESYWQEILKQTKKIQGYVWIKKHIPFVNKKEISEAINLLNLGAGKETVFNAEWFKKDHPYSEALNAKPSDLAKLFDEYREKFGIK